MKKAIAIGLLLTLVLSLSGCGADAGAQSRQTISNGLLSQDYANALSVAAQLVVGTLKLEGGAQAVTAEQAADLLPLWKAHRSLSQSSSASPLELEGLVTQIIETMTEEQVAAIAAMRLTRQDLTDVMQARGLFAQSGVGSGSSASQAARTSGVGPGSGGPGMDMGPGGGVPGMGPGAPVAGAPQSATAQAQRATTVGASVSPALYDALVELLKAKA